MTNIAIVILHYETIEDTEKCLDSIIIQNYDSCRVVVVDNGSKESGTDLLKSKYSYSDKIFFVDSKENLGFAKGNNLGFDYAKKYFNPDVIVLSNNDVVFDSSFLKVLDSVYLDEEFDVAGPKIISLVDGLNQNPVNRFFANLTDVNKHLLKLYFFRLMCIANLDQIIRRKASNPIEEFVPQTGEDFQLHGACLLFGKNFINKYDGLFPGTFMYGEEDILRYIVDRDGLKMKYIDTLTVFHQEGSSTGKVFGKERNKRQFFYKWSINSMKELKKLMKANL